MVVSTSGAEDDQSVVLSSDHSDTGNSCQIPSTGQTTSVSSDSASFSAQLCEGQQTITAPVADIAGNTSAVSSPVLLLVDITDGSAAVAAPGQNPYTSAHGTINTNGTSDLSDDTLPVGILISFLVMHFQGINANIMSLGGIAIAVGVMVDAAVVMVENAHKHLERDGGKKEHWEIILEAAKEVGPALFFSLLIVTLSFLPVFTLQAQEGSMFKPLAYTKTYAMAASALLAITIVPVLMGFFVRGRILPERRNPLNRALLSRATTSPSVSLRQRRWATSVPLHLRRSRYCLSG